MFDVGFSELLLLSVVSLLILGPERLPGFARKVGLYVRKAKSVFNDVRREVEREIEIEEVKEKLNALEKNAKQDTLMEEVKDASKAVEKLTDLNTADSNDR